MLFRSFGIAKRTVVLHRTGRELDSVLQLVISDTTDSEVSGLAQKPCSYGRCQGRKYMPIVGQPFPLPLSAPAPIFRSRQYFCDAAFHIVYASSELVAAIKAARLKGAIFEWPSTGQSLGKQSTAYSR